jgi:ATP/maltotriose-dependent transcriptional regulator MalT
VESHLKRLYAHLGVRTAMQAVLTARALGLIGDARTVGLRSLAP